jgi:hypothetical protein
MEIIKKTNNLETVFENELVILNMDTGKYIQLNSSAKNIWNLLEKFKDVDKIKAELKDMFLVTDEELEHDMDNFISSAKEAELIEVSY